MIYATTYLCHSSTNKKLVRQVACELTKRGVIPWLDKNELLPGDTLSQRFSEEINRQTTLTVFLSDEAVDSAWVNEELQYALEVESQDNQSFIIPVFLGDMLQLVKSCDPLRSKWLHPDGNRVVKNGIVVNESTPDAQNIATRIAEKIYYNLSLKEKNEVAICIDQRGEGKRHGKPGCIPNNLKNQNIPCLVYRPDMNERSTHEVITEPTWSTTIGTLKSSLSQALGNPRSGNNKTIRLIGNGQPAFAFYLGWYFDRSSHVKLFCMDTRGNVFNDKEQPRYSPIKGGNENCETHHPKIEPIDPKKELNTISLALVKEEIIGGVIGYHETRNNPPPLVYVKHPDKLDSNERLMEYVSDVIALLMRMRNHNKLQSMELYTSLPFHAIPILSANFKHVVDQVKFMEFQRYPQGTDPRYAPLTMPS